MSATEPAVDGIAVVGMALRFPGANSPSEFWRNLCAGVESRREFTESELQAAGLDRAEWSDPHYVNAGMTIDDVDLFDAAFFGLSPREAAILDPQHRLFLESAWEALEAAAYDPEQFAGAIGLFGGVFLSTYLHENLLPSRALLREAGELTVRHGNEKDYLTTRTSYRLNLTGPSVAIQSACSTGLVAVHMACQSLWSHECDVALAGACSVRVPTRQGYFYEPGGIASPDGHCRPFDARAAGTVFGHGLGVVVLRRLDEALADGDVIHAVLRGSAINNDGSQKVGFTAPSVDGQSAVIAEALSVSGVEPEDIGYVEAHGTGTALGDPIEIEALTQAFRARTAERGFCALGSVKSNIGHLGTASGIAGLIKTVLVLKNGRIPPTLHFESPNPKIDFAASPFEVNTRLRDWVTPGTPRRAGLSSFGMGGTNAHAILEEAPPRRPGGPARPVQLLPLSARTPAALSARTAALLDYLRGAPAEEPADLAFTLAVGRQGFAQRRFLVCHDLADAAAALGDPEPTRILTGPAPARRRSVAFLFPGQGAQYPGMANGLYREEAVFRQAVDECFAILQGLGLDLRSIVEPTTDAERQSERQSERDAERDAELRQTGRAQPAIFVVAYGMARLWMSWGVRPAVMVGHSVGEYVAACLSGVLSLADALGLVVERGRLMQSLPPGSMLAVSLPESELRPLLTGSLALAAVNGPGLSVAAGEPADVERLEGLLAARGVTGRRLHTSHAFHSSMMDPILPAFRKRLSQVAWSAPEIPFFSNLTGREATAAEVMDPEYWVRHLRHTVRFGESLGRLLGDTDLVFVEVGPGRTLSSLVRQQPGPAEGRVVVSSLRHPQDRVGDLEFLLTSLGRLWMAGVTVDWHAFYDGQERRRVELPTYPFERQRFWIEPQPAATSLASAATAATHERLWAPLWTQEPHVPRLVPRSTAGIGGPARWLILADSAAGLGPRMAARLAARGHSVAQVGIGRREAGFRSVGDHAYELDPLRPEGYTTLLAELAATGWEPDVAVHLWSLAPDAGEEVGRTSVALLGKALAGRGRPLEIGMVTSGLCEVTGGEALSPERATLLGACRVLPWDHPVLRCRVLDVEPVMGGAADVLVERLLAELGGAPAGDLVAYRGRHRWVAAYQPVRFTTDEPSEAEIPAALAAGPVVLLAGTPGEPASTLVEWLTKTVGSRLRIVEGGLHPAGPEGEEPWRAVGRALTGDGAPGTLFVFPAAGADGDHEIAGLRSLLSGLAGSEPGLLVLVGPLAAQVGGPGRSEDAVLGAYCAALARRRSAAGQPTLALAWGGVSREEAMAALPRALDCGLAEVVLSPVHPARLWELGELGESGEPGAAADGAVPVGAAQESLPQHPRPALGNPYLAPRGEAERALVEIWQQGLGIDRIGIHDNFFELGGDSLLAIRIAEEVKRRFAVEITTASLFEGPTVASLATIVSPGEPGANPATSETSATLSPMAESVEQGARRRERARTRAGAARRARDAGDLMEEVAVWDDAARRNEEER